MDDVDIVGQNAVRIAAINALSAIIFDIDGQNLSP